MFYNEPLLALLFFLLYYAIRLLKSFWPNLVKSGMFISRNFIFEYASMYSYYRVRVEVYKFREGIIEKPIRWMDVIIMMKRY